MDMGQALERVKLEIRALKAQLEHLIRRRKRLEQIEKDKVK